MIGCLLLKDFNDPRRATRHTFGNLLVQWSCNICTSLLSSKLFCFDAVNLTQSVRLSYSIIPLIFCHYFSRLCVMYHHHTICAVHFLKKYMHINRKLWLKCKQNWTTLCVCIKKCRRPQICRKNQPLNNLLDYCKHFIVRRNQLHALRSYAPRMLVSLVIKRLIQIETISPKSKFFSSCLYKERAMSTRENWTIKRWFTLIGNSIWKRRWRRRKIVRTLCEHSWPVIFVKVDQCRWIYIENLFYGQVFACLWIFACSMLGTRTHTVLITDIYTHLNTHYIYLLRVVLGKLSFFSSSFSLPNHFSLIYMHM